MKKTIYRPVIFYLCLLFIMMIFNCRSQVKPEPKGIKVPGLAKTFSKLKKVCKEKGKKGEKSKSIFVDTTNSTGKNLQIVYDPDKDKIQLTVFDREDSMEIVRNIVLFKGINEVKSGDAWIDKDKKGVHTQEDMKEEELKNLMAKF